MAQACASFWNVSSGIQKFPNKSLPIIRTRLLQALSARMGRPQEIMRKVLKLIYNFHWIAAGEAARSAQAVMGGLSTLLASQKIRGVINLRGRNPGYGWWRYETRICMEMGIVHVDAMLDSRKLPTRAMLNDLLSAFDTTPKPFLIKCSGGQDRTGFAAALYLLHRRGWTAQGDARKQFARWPYLHFPKTHQRWLLPFFDYARTQAAGLGIAQWIDAQYDPHRFAQWLDANGYADTYKEVFLKPEASRWQW
jgi:hypothetical protein